MAAESQKLQATIIVGTYGSRSWSRLALKRAVPSAQKGVRVIHEHGNTLAHARNLGLEKVETEWVVFLDGDDELEPGYLEIMERGTADLRVPSVRSVWPHNNVEDFSVIPNVAGHDHQCMGECLRYGNWCVIGTAVRADMVRSVGGFEEWGWSEDWALWARCWKAGATFEPMPEAIYRAHKRHGSRNKQANGVTVNWHRKIEAAVWPEEESVL